MVLFQICYYKAPLDTPLFFLGMRWGYIGWIGSLCCCSSPAIFLGPTLGCTEVSINPVFHSPTSLTLQSFNKKDYIDLLIDPMADGLINVRGVNAYVAVYRSDGSFVSDTKESPDVLRNIVSWRTRLLPGDFILYGLSIYPLVDCARTIREFHPDPIPFQNLFKKFRDGAESYEREMTFSLATPCIHMGIVRVANVGALSFEKFTLGCKQLKINPLGRMVDKYMNINQEDYIWLKVHSMESILKVNDHNSLILLWRPSKRRLVWMGSLPNDSMKQTLPLDIGSKSFKLREGDCVIMVFSVNPLATFDIKAMKDALWGIDNDPFDYQLDLLLRELSGDFLLFAQRVLPLNRNPE